MGYSFCVCKTDLNKVTDLLLQAGEEFETTSRYVGEVGGDEVQEISCTSHWQRINLLMTRSRYFRVYEDGEVFYFPKD